jgi:hypothetical protein
MLAPPPNHSHASSTAHKAVSLTVSLTQVREESQLLPFWRLAGGSSCVLLFTTRRSHIVQAYGSPLDHADLKPLEPAAAKNLLVATSGRSVRPGRHAFPRPSAHTQTYTAKNIMYHIHTLTSAHRGLPLTCTIPRRVPSQHKALVETPEDAAALKALVGMSSGLPAMLRSLGGMCRTRSPCAVRGFCPVSAVHTLPSTRSFTPSFHTILFAPPFTPPTFTP